MRAAKVQASLRIRAVSPEPSLLAHTSSESRGTFRQKARSLAPLNGWACAVKICNDGMLEDTNSLDGAHYLSVLQYLFISLPFSSAFWSRLFPRVQRITLLEHRRNTIKLVADIIPYTFDYEMRFRFALVALIDI